MIKLSDLQWNVDVIKSLTFEEFNDKVQHYLKMGKLDKASDQEIRRFYEKLTKTSK